MRKALEEEAKKKKKEVKVNEGIMENLINQEFGPKEPPKNKEKEYHRVEFDYSHMSTPSFSSCHLESSNSK